MRGGLTKVDRIKVHVIATALFLSGYVTLCWWIASAPIQWPPGCDVYPVPINWSGFRIGCSLIGSFAVALFNLGVVWVIEWLEDRSHD